MSHPVGGRAVPAAATVCLVGIAALFTVVAVLYFVDPATDLPSFLPGHDLVLNRHRTKHGLLAAVLAAAALIAAVLGMGHRAPNSRVRGAPHGLAPPGVRGAGPPAQRTGGSTGFADRTDAYRDEGDDGFPRRR